MKSHLFKNLIAVYWSPSLGREWIEIAFVTWFTGVVLSPSLGREWIEIERHKGRIDQVIVSLLGEGVD